MAITSHHDRRPPALAANPGRLFRLVAVACLASSAVLDVCPELAWGGEGGAFLSVTKDGGGVRGRAIVRPPRGSGAACTAQFSATLASGDAYHEEEDRRRFDERHRRARAHAACVRRLSAWDDHDLTTLPRTPRTVSPATRDAVFVHRRSNTQWRGYKTQVVRNLRVFREVVRVRPDAHDRLHLLYLDGVKGADVVPVGAGPETGRRVYARSLERGADREFAIQALNGPQGPERSDLGTFVVDMLSSLVAHEGGPRVADVFVSPAPSTRRRASDGACSCGTFGRRPPSTMIRRRVLRDDGSVRLEDPWVRGSLATGDRLWRLVNTLP